jgi:hypothetical protein
MPLSAGMFRIATNRNKKRYLIVTSTSADIPGVIRDSYPLILWASKTILTGMRWTILVKLPVALSGGSKAN